jgi:hypothetical protein
MVLAIVEMCGDLFRVQNLLALFIAVECAMPASVQPRWWGGARTPNGPSPTPRATMISWALCWPAVRAAVSSEHFNF